MASPELLQSWARTAKLLEKARELLSAAVVQEQETVLLQIDEFLDHNSFDWLKSIAQESGIQANY